MVFKNVKLSSHDCLPISLLLHIMLAYSMLFTALSNAVCLHNAFSMLLIFANAFCFHAMSWFIGTLVCLFQALYCVMRSSFNMLVFQNYMFM